MEQTNCEELEELEGIEAMVTLDDVISKDDVMMEEEELVLTTDDDLTDDDVVMLTGVEVILTLEDDIFAVQTEKIRYRVSRKIPKLMFGLKIRKFSVSNGKSFFQSLQTWSSLVDQKTYV